MLWILLEQNQVSAAATYSQHQVENTVERFFVQRFGIEPLQQLRHETVETTVRAVTQGYPPEAPHKEGQRAVHLCCRRLVNFLPVDVQTAPPLGPFLIFGPFGL